MLFIQRLHSVSCKMYPAQWVALHKPRPIFLGRCGSLNFHICTQFRHVVQLAACGSSFGRVVALIANSYMCVWNSRVYFAGEPNRLELLFCFVLFLFLLICRQFVQSCAILFFLPSLQVRWHLPLSPPSRSEALADSRGSDGAGDGQHEAPAPPPAQNLPQLLHPYCCSWYRGTGTFWLRSGNIYSNIFSKRAWTLLTTNTNCAHVQ